MTMICQDTCQDICQEIRPETPFDVARREALLDAAFGESRFAKTAERLREGRLPAEGLSFVAVAADRVVGTVRLWNVAAGPGRPALLLGPLAIDSEVRDRGIGGALMAHALGEAGHHGHAAVLLVGDAPYYGRFGFSADKTAALWLPGPYARDRLLAHEIIPGALDGARGLIGATGRRKGLRRLKSGLLAAVAGPAENDSALASHAA
jgi:predicted N-acetyltransferase YhbS